MAARLGIVGAGIAGLAAGLACRQLGIDFQLFDAAEDPLAGGTGITLWPNALCALSELGMRNFVDVVASNAMTNGGIATDRGAVLYSLPLAWIRRQYGYFPVCVRRDVLQRRMYEALDEPKIVRAQVHRVLTSKDGAVVVGSHGQLWYDAVIIADGIHSQARNCLYPVQPRPTHYTAWRGMTHGAVVDPATMWEYWGLGVRFGYASVSPQSTYWFATVNQSHLRDGDSWTVARTLLERFPPPVQACIAATADSDILHHRVQDLPPGCPMAMGHIALMGDAAHAITPNLGFGGALAIEDAAVWLEVVRDAGVSPAAFGIYADRRGAGFAKWRMSRGSSATSCSGKAKAWRVYEMHCFT
ncbi:salicylate hydroxylase [Alicyclobacillus sacchari]|uniref:FAD-dependent monooxygenase n=1 Tax=Alicyclobacillus sacchari TaxID=392010 RepID=UPI0023E98685|nr:FAD-dependent monooxygenase [Alicyclobacillus sacchari]GMA57476.1 salicylate hydroxylase [Alicyclobacillus sacchari]